MVDILVLHRRTTLLADSERALNAMDLPSSGCKYGWKGMLGNGQRTDWGTCPTTTGCPIPSGPCQREWNIKLAGIRFGWQWLGHAGMLPSGNHFP